MKLIHPRCRHGTTSKTPSDASTPTTPNTLSTINTDNLAPNTPKQPRTDDNTQTSHEADNTINAIPTSFCEINLRDSMTNDVNPLELQGLMIACVNNYSVRNRCAAKTSQVIKKYQGYVKYDENALHENGRSMSF